MFLFGRPKKGGWAVRPMKGGLIGTPLCRRRRPVGSVGGRMFVVSRAVSSVETPEAARFPSGSLGP